MKTKDNTTTAIIYRNKRQPILYGVSILTLALSVFVAYMIFSNLERFLEEFSSLLSAIFWMAFMLVMGNVMFICMLWLSGRYILCIERTGENFVLIQTWSIIGLHRTKKYPAEILDTADFRLGKSNIPHTPVVIAPYSIVRTPKGKKLIWDVHTA
ncbi:hypothetical protein [Sphingobacterium lumbrici]|uniref:hypothetical protein n=1 Tax=Sphingobacterium lumbrici TaxID=2559600 RepID=UPI00112CED67|nr:hypothetical protein [Sphingobacterium lumbrici]